jgi:hypothetical protein
MPSFLSVVTIFCTLAVYRGQATCVPPQVDDIQPRNGANGTRVTITGCGLSEVKRVRFRSTQVQPEFSVTNTSDGSTLQTRIAGHILPPKGNASVDLLDGGGNVTASLNSSYWEWLPDCKIGFLLPFAGQSGTKITFDGCFPPQCASRSTSLTRITIGGIKAEILSQSGTRVIVRAGYSANAIPDAQMVFIAGSGATSTTQKTWKYFQPGNITSLTPNKGSHGTKVIIKGESLFGVQRDSAGNRETIPGNLADIKSVTLAGLLCTVMSATPSSISVIVPSGLPNNSVPYTGDVQIETMKGPFLVKENGWTQLADGVITSIVPSTMQPGGEVALCGINLLGGGSSIRMLTMAGRTVSNPSFREFNSTCTIVMTPLVPITSPLPLPGPVKIIANTFSIITSQAGLTFAYARIDNISPMMGRQGTRVAITGSHLDLQSGGIANVYLAGVLATILTSSPDQITVRAGIGPPLGSASDSVKVISLGNDTFNATIELALTLNSSWTYIGAGSILNVTPSEGQVGTYVNISGLSLLGLGKKITKVEIGKLTATILSDSNTSVRISTPASSSFNTSVDLVIESDTGAQTIKQNAFIFLAPGKITSSTPPYGQLGTKVTVMGTNLLGNGEHLASATLVGIPAIIESQTSSQVVLSAGEYKTSTPRSGPIVLASVNGATVTSTSLNWTYVVPGQIIVVNPPEGQLGTHVTISGSSLLGNGTSLLHVTLCDLQTRIVSFTSNVIIVEVRSDVSSERVGDIVITANTGATVIRRQGWICKPKGRITNISPTTGYFGTRVTITGSNLLAYGSKIMNATVASVSVLSVIEVSTSRVVLRVGEAASGVSGNVVLVADTGASVSSNVSFIYSQPGNITSVSPASGVEGTLVIIEGFLLHGAGTFTSDVKLSGVPVRQIVSDSESKVIAVAGPTPSGAPITLGTVEVTSSTGSIVKAEQAFLYSEPAQVTFVSPSSGQQGTRVEIRLTVSSSMVREVFIADTEASVTSISASGLVVRLGRPSRQGTFTGDITVVLHNSTIARKINGFTYTSEGVIFTVSPRVGQIGTNISVIGRNLLGNGTYLVSASLAGLAGKVVLSSDTEAVIVVSDHSLTKNVGNLTLESNTGAITTMINGWESIPAGIIQSVSPNIGQLGTIVTIRGERLFGGGTRLVAIHLSGIPVMNITFSSDSLVVVQAADGMGAVNQSVTLTSNTGSIVELQQGWMYRPSGQIMSISPMFGQYGTLVTIKGSNLLGQGTSINVTLGQAEAMTVIHASNSEVVVRVDSVENVTGVAENVTITANTGAFITRIAKWTYKRPGIITSVYPPSGQVGTEVVVKGSNLFGYGSRIRRATIGGITSTVKEQTNSEIVISAGLYPNATSNLTILLESDSGALVYSKHTFSYLTPGKIVSVWPESGLEGTMVTINGSELFGYGRRLRNITLAGVPASFDPFSVSSSKVVVTAGSRPQAGSGPIVITSSSGAKVIYVRWTYIQGGVISDIIPSVGQTGTEATLLGSHLLSGGTKVRSVIVNGSPSISIKSDDNERIVFQLGPPVLPTPSQIEVSVILNTGATYSTSKNPFMYNNVTDGRVTSVSPEAGHEGVTVKIQGTNLLNGGSILHVLLAGIRAQTQSANDTLVTVTAGHGFDTMGDVIVVSSNGYVSGLHNGWSFLPFIPRSAVTPLEGQEGTRVTIKSPKALLSFKVSSVTIVGIKAQLVSTNATRTFTDDRNNSDTEVVQELLLVAGPSSRMVTGNIVLRSSVGEELVINANWSYLPVQSVESVYPLLGYNGTLVTIIGRYLLAGGSRIMSVSLASVPTSIVNQTTDSFGRNNVTVEVTPDKEILANLSGKITIISDNGATVVPQGIHWTYLGVKVASVSPTNGQFGTRVAISGNYLFAGANSITSATLAGIPAKVSPESTNSRVVLVANNSLPSVDGDIILNMDTGAQTVIPQTWAYLEEGNITNIQPTLGQEGTVVRITGTRLLGGGKFIASAFLSDIQVREVVASSPIYVEVVAGKGPAMGSGFPGTVSLVADTGAKVSRSIGFEYVSVGAVSGISPQFGQYGTEVTLQGSGFLSGALSLQYVKLAGVDATIIGEPSNTSVTVRAGFPSRLDAFSGTVEVRSSSGGIVSSDRSLQFAYIQSGQIYSVSPNSGQLGTIVQITGNNLFGGGTTIHSAYFGNVTATIVLPITNESLILQAGESLIPGKVNITLISDTNATVVKLDGWEYLAPSYITDVRPATGRQGTRIRITGVRLTGGGKTISNVQLSGIDVMSINYTSGADFVDVRAGNGSMASSAIGDVVVISDTGAQTILTKNFTYARPGHINTISPSSGISNDKVNISGNNFLGEGNTIVMATFGGIEAQVNHSSDSLVTVLVGFNDDGEPKPDIDVYLEADTGDVTYAARAWSYQASCKGNQFGLYPNNCTNCSLECNRCFDVGNNNCRECKYFILPNETCVFSCPKFIDGKRCVDSCQDSQYFNSSNYCLPCSKLCNPNFSCTYPGGPGDCKVCQDVRDDGVCKNECPVEKYRDKNHICQPCHSECKHGLGCQGPNAWECNKCANFSLTINTDTKNLTGHLTASFPPAFVPICVKMCLPDYFDDNKQCFQCNDQCSGGCNGFGSHQCKDCKSFKANNGSCVASCNPNPGLSLFFVDNKTNICKPCHLQCSSEKGCNGPYATDCYSCRNLSLPFENGTKCVGQCPSKHYANEQFQCLECDKSCSSGCTGPNPSDCTESSATVGDFDAGTGTIAVVAVVCITLLLATIILLGCYCYKVHNDRYHVIPSPTDSHGPRSSRSPSTKTDVDEKPPTGTNGETLQFVRYVSGLKEEYALENYTPMDEANVRPETAEAEEYTIMDNTEPVADTVYMDAEPVPLLAPRTSLSTTPPPPPPSTQEMYDDINPEESGQLYEDQLYEDVQLMNKKKDKDKERPISQSSTSTPSLFPNLPPRDKKLSQGQSPDEQPPMLGPKPGGLDPQPPPIQPRSPISLSLQSPPILGPKPGGSDPPIIQPRSPLSVTPQPPMLGPKPGQGSDAPALPPRNETKPPEPDLEEIYEDCSNAD